MSHEYSPFQAIEIDDLAEQSGTSRMPTVQESEEAVEHSRQRVAQAIFEESQDEAAAQAGNRRRLGRDWMSEVPIGQDQREDQPRYPVIAYSQVPEGGGDVNQVRQNLEEKADARAGESIDGFYDRYPYLGRPVSEGDWNRVEEFQVGLLQRNEERAGLALHDFYDRHPWL